MTTYMQELQEACEADHAERQQKKETVDAERAASWRDTMRPLKDRLADLLSTIPDEVKTTGLSLSTLQVRLRGRTASRAHCGEVAAALRQLGFRRIRLWKQSDTDGFNAVWKSK
ncbi:MAG: hypothetical protein NTV11_18015 [Rhodocyclales bacterium]|nr:hypothetical protein [Rhodocyclales bacterium]